MIEVGWDFDTYLEPQSIIGRKTRSWGAVSKMEDLSLDFIIKYNSKLNWDTLSSNPSLDENVVSGYIDYYYNEKISLTKLYDCNWRWLLLSRNPSLSSSFIKKTVFNHRYNYRKTDTLKLVSANTVT